MRFRDKIGPLHDPILKPAILPDFLAVARTRRLIIWNLNGFGTNGIASPMLFEAAENGMGVYLPISKGWL